MDQVSGARDRRPALDYLRADVRAGRIDVVLIWALDRLGRSLLHLLNIAEELQSHGVDLVCMTQPIDTTTPAGRLTYQVLGAVAEFERGMIRARINAGLSKAKALGKHLGRPQRWTSDQADHAVKLRAEGRSWRSVAMAVGLPTRTVRRAVDAVAKARSGPGPPGSPENET
jgi:DNA invertase Pin-like site-specific DNA recombinase